MDDLMNPSSGRYGHAHRALGDLISYTLDDFTPATYVPPRTIETTHNLPRYGFPNNIGALFVGSDEQRQEYVWGVLIGAITILAVMLVWFLVIASLSIAGQKRVGFFAGRLVQPASAKSFEGDGEEKGGVEVVMAPDQQNFDGEGEHDINEGVPVASTSNAADAAKTARKFKRKVWAVRGMFLLSALMVIVAGGLFYGKGVVSFRNSLDEVRRGIDLVQDAANQAINLTEGVLEVGEEMEEEMEPTKEVVQDKGQICGLETETSTAIREAYDRLSESIEQLKSMLDTTLEDFASDLRALVQLTEDIDNGLENADIVFYILLAVSIVIIVLILCMMAGVVFASLGVSNCFTKCIYHAIIWPLFIFFLILSWILATLFLILSLGGADFCIKPDEYVQNFLDSNADMFDGLIFGFIIFYVSGCTITPPGEEEIREFVTQTSVVMTIAHDFIERVGNLDIQQLQTLCGLTEQEAAAVTSLVNLIHDTIHVLNRSVVGLRDVLKCETFNPIYTTFVHDAFCVQGVGGLTYIFSTTLVIAIFSMVLIMFRAALYPIKESNAPPLASRSDEAIEVVKYEVDSDAEEDKAVIY